MQLALDASVLANDFGQRLHLGRIAKEIFEHNQVVVYGFLDDDKKKHQTEVDDVNVLGSMDDEDFLKLIGKKCEAFVAVDETKLRKGGTANR